MQIVAMGGGGFSMEPENLLLDQYILGLAGKSKAKVCFVPTASGDSENYIQRFYDSFGSLSCEPSHLSLFKPPTSQLEEFVMEKDIIYVGGGNTRNLLVLWKEWQLDRIFHKAWQSGIILAGVSAGSICWFEEGVTDSIPGKLSPLKCLGFLPGSNCPHYDGEAERRPSYHRLVGSGEINAGYAADDGAALHFSGTGLTKTVSSRPSARAYKVYKDSGGVIEEEIVPELLSVL
jgi:dipeptidase E